MTMLVLLIGNRQKASVIGALLLSLPLTNSVGELLQHWFVDNHRSAADHSVLHVHVDPKFEVNQQQDIYGLLCL